jgi:D-glycero-D-manno-heptose 1,7-bisphosphate phosphatase
MGLKGVFLDRDGVINRAVIRNGKPYPPSSLSELKFLPGVLQSLQKLSEAGYCLMGVTNQPDVARGVQKREIVERINLAILSKLPIREIFTCYHDNKDDCSCRKPKPGLILQGAEKYKIDLSQSWMVGDRWKDIAAGKSAGLRTIFVNNNYKEAYLGPPADFIIQNTAELSRIILIA